MIPLRSHRGATKLLLPSYLIQDMGPDYDDVGALTLLHAFADSGECTLLADNREQTVTPTLPPF